MIKETKPGHLEITCDICGKPITKTSEKWGMDCEDDCGQKEAKKLMNTPMGKALGAFLGLK